MEGGGGRFRLGFGFGGVGGVGIVTGGVRGREIWWVFACIVCTLVGAASGKKKRLTAYRHSRCLVRLIILMQGQRPHTCESTAIIMQNILSTLTPLARYHT